MDLLNPGHFVGLGQPEGKAAPAWLIPELQRMLDASLNRLYPARTDRYRPEVTLTLSSDPAALIKRPGYSHALGVDGHTNSNSSWWWQRWIEIQVGPRSKDKEPVRVAIPWLLTADDNNVAADVVGGHEGLFVGGPKIPVIQARLTPDLHVLAPRARKQQLPDNTKHHSDGLNGPFEVLLVPDWGSSLIVDLNQSQYSNPWPYYVSGSRSAAFERQSYRLLRVLAGQDPSRHLTKATLDAVVDELRVGGDLATYERLLAKQYPFTKAGHVRRVAEFDAAERQFTTRLAYWLRANAHAIASEPPSPEPAVDSEEFSAVAQEYVEQPVRKRGATSAAVDPVRPVAGPGRGGELRYWPHHLVAALQRGVRTAEATLGGRAAKDKPKRDANDAAKAKFHDEVADTLRWALGSSLGDVVVGRGDFAGLLLDPTTTDTLARLEQYRQVTFFGPGGLSRHLRGRLDLRVLDESWRNWLCPVQTPESDDIGLVRFLALGQTNGADAGEARDLSAAAALIPYLNHTDAARAALGAKNLKQAVALVEPERPTVTTGWDARLAAAGIANLSPDRDRYGPANVRRAGPVSRWGRSPNATQAFAPDVVGVNDEAGSHSLALGRNAFVALTPWYGFNNEDGVVVSESFARKMTSRHNVVIRQRLDGPERVSGWTQLVEDGDEVSARQSIVQIAKDRLVTSPEVGILRHVYADDEGIRIVIEVTRPLEVGDKVTNRHGGKGVVCLVVPDADMPTVELPTSRSLHGEKIDVVLNPLGALNRLNFGQMWEMHDSLARRLAADVPATESALLDPLPVIAGRAAPDGGQLHERWFALFARHFEPSDEKKQEALRRGRLRLSVGQRRFGDAGRGVVVGEQYILKLDHLAADKCRARGEQAATSARTLQPLRRTTWDLGRVSGSPQRMGEMEGWALQSVGARAVLRDLIWNRSRAEQITDQSTKPTMQAAEAHLAVAGIEVSSTEDGEAGRDFDIDTRWSAQQINPLGNEVLAEIVAAGKADVARDEHPLYRAELYGGDGANDVRWSLRLPEPVPHPWDPFAPPIRQLGILPPAMRTFGSDPLDRAYADVADAVLKLKKELIVQSGSKPSKSLKAIRAALADAVECVLGGTEYYLKYKPLLVAREWRTIPVNDPDDPGELKSAFDAFTLALSGVEPPIDPDGESGPDGANAQDEPTETEEELAAKVAQFKAERADGVELYAGSARRGRALRVPLDASILARLEGKMGLLRRHLLGSAAVRSGRAVIVGDPTLSPNVVKVPREIYRAIVGTDDRASDIARQVADRFLDGLEVVELSRVVLLNRQPTLRPNALLALEAEEWEGRALVLNPLVLGCLAGDFDGDTAAVHWPVSPAARLEAWEQFRPAVRLPNLAKPGATLAKIDLDVALGVHLATTATDGPEHVQSSLGLALEAGASAESFVAAVEQRLVSTDAVRTVTQDSTWLHKVFEFGCVNASGWSIGALDLLLDGGQSPPFTEARLAGVAGRSARFADSPGRSGPTESSSAPSTLIDGLDSADWFSTAPESIDGLAVKKLLTSEAGTFTKDLVELGYEVSTAAEQCESTIRSPLACQCPPPAICRGCLGGVSWCVDFDRGPAVGQLAGMLIGEYSTQRTLKKDTSDTLGNLQPLFGGRGRVQLPPPPPPPDAKPHLARSYWLPIWSGLSAHQDAGEALKFVLEAFGQATERKIDSTWAEILLRQLWFAARVLTPDPKVLLHPSLIHVSRSVIASSRARNTGLAPERRYPITGAQRAEQEQIVQDYVSKSEAQINLDWVMDVWQQRWVEGIDANEDSYRNVFDLIHRTGIRDYGDPGITPVLLGNKDMLMRAEEAETWDQCADVLREDAERLIRMKLGEIGVADYQMSEEALGELTDEFFRGRARRDVIDQFVQRVGDSLVYQEPDGTGRVDLAKPLARELISAAFRQGGPEGSWQTLLSSAINSRTTALGLGTIRGNVSHLVERVRQESWGEAHTDVPAVSYRNALLVGRF